MPIDNRDLVVEGARLTGRYKKADYVCVVERDAEGNLAFAVDGKTFKSPSSAASHVMGGGAVNGWRFWSVEGAATTAPTVANVDALLANAGRTPKAPRTRASKRSTFKVIRKMEEQPSDLDEGQAAWWCSACMRSFIAGADQPDACPEGHKADGSDLAGEEAPASEPETVEVGA